MTGVLRFGPFEMDPSSGDLRRSGLPVKLQPQPARVLAYLATHPGQLVTREELRENLWRGEALADVDQALNFCIRQIRAAIGDDPAHPTYIETAPKRGYRFLVQPGARRPRYRRYALAAAAAVILMLAGWFAWRRVAARDAAPGRVLLAVLPFDNLSGDAGQDYLADGLTEEMIGRLASSNPGRLGVIARTSVMRYKGSPRDIRAIARDLGTRYVLEGSVRRAGDRVRVSAQLIDAASQAHIWAATYDRKLEDVLALQSEVAQSVIEGIRLKLPGRAAATPPRPVDREAYEAYLKGAYFCRTLTGADVRKGIEYLERAIARDPSYAPAYAALAQAYYAVSNMRIDPRRAMEQARQAAQKAIALDPALADAHLALAVVRAFYDWDWPAAEREFRRTLDLNAGSADAHVMYGVFLAQMGRLHESEAELENARRLDPLSLFVNNTRALPMYLTGRYDDAIAQLRKTLELDPNFYFAHIGLGTALVEKREYAEAIAAYEKARQLDDSPETAAFLARARALAGDQDTARRALAELQAAGKTRFVSPYDVALVYEALGERAEALRYLEMAYEARAEGLIALRVDPRLAGLRSEPRFRALEARMNFPK